MDESRERRISYLARVYREINDIVLTRSHASKLIGHNLEKGLSNEEILRQVLAKILPRSYGIGKGHIMNQQWEMSKQCDIIVYDALGCPNLFVDDDGNQVLPIEGVYAVIEVKTHLTHTKLEEAFEVARSVKDLREDRVNVSTNDHVRISPPLFSVLAYRDDRSMESIYDDYLNLSVKFPTKLSSLSYDKASPGFASHTGQHYLVEEIVIVNKGIVYYMYDGFPVILPAGSDALGMFIVTQYLHLAEMKLPIPSLLQYYGETTLLYETKTRIRDGFVDIKSARDRKMAD